MYDIGLLLLRVAFGGVMLVAHGWPKLIGFTDKMNAFPDPIGFGSPISLALCVFAEVVCSILLILGFKTRLALPPLIITMLIAFFVIHAADPFGQKELAFMYLLAYIGLLFTGAGKYSLDRR